MVPTKLSKGRRIHDEDPDDLKATGPSFKFSICLRMIPLPSSIMVPAWSGVESYKYSDVADAARAEQSLKRLSISC